MNSCTYVLKLMIYEFLYLLILCEFSGRIIIHMNSCTYVLKLMIYEFLYLLILCEFNGRILIHSVIIQYYSTYIL